MAAPEAVAPATPATNEPEQIDDFSGWTPVGQAVQVSDSAPNQDFSGWTPVGDAIPVGSSQHAAQSQKDTGVVAGLKRNTVGVVQGIYHALTDPPSEQEKAQLLQKIREHNDSPTVRAGGSPRIEESSSQNPSRAAMAYHRILDLPADALLEKGKSEEEAALDLLKHHEFWKGGNLYLSGLTDRLLSKVPLVGPAVNSIAERAEGSLGPAYTRGGERIPLGQVPEERKDFAGAATDVSAALALENAKPIAKLAGKTVAKTSEIAGKAANKLSTAELRPSQLRMPAEPPKPVAAHTPVEIPLDDAAIRKSFNKNLTQDARETLRQHVGETIPAGSSVENHLMSAIKPANETIAAQGSELNRILHDAEPLQRAPEHSNYVYRVRDVGEKGVPSESHSQATASYDEANNYVAGRQAVQGKPQQIVAIDLNKLDPSDYVRMARDEDSPDWVRFNRILSEREIEPVPNALRDEVNLAMENLRNNLPGGTEETFGKALDKEITRADTVLESTDPLEINDYIRQLDKRIDSYNAPEEPIDTASNAADAARVTIRRVLRDKLNREIPETQPINEVLGKNLELRKALEKKFGDIAHDPVGAEGQHLSELQKGKRYMEFEARREEVLRNLAVLKKLGFTAATLAGLGITKELWHLIP